MPGVQVLFAFLLTVPFQQRFATVSSFQRDVYLVTLLAAATATAFLVAPSAYHRIAFQKHEKERIIQMGTRQFVCGLVALAVAMNLAVLLVCDVLFQTTTTVLVVVGVASMFGWLWFGIGLRRRSKR
jgi:uncharacterized RDD family membrane protein YckC